MIQYISFLLCLLELLLPNLVCLLDQNLLIFMDNFNKLVFLKYWQLNRSDSEANDPGSQLLYFLSTSLINMSD